MIRSTITILCLSLAFQHFAHADVLFSDDFFYNQPTKALGPGGGFQLQDYGGGQNGGNGSWNGRWVSSGNAIITGHDIEDRVDDFPDFDPDLDVYVGLTQGGLSAQFLQRGYELSGLDPLQPIYFGVSTRTAAEDAIPNTMMVIHNPGIENGQIGIGFADGGFQAQLGGAIDFDTADTSDAEFHRLIGKLEINADGDNERLTVWLDATEEGGGEGEITVTSQVIDSVNDLSGVLQLLGAAERTFWDDVAIGTSFESVVDVSVPRLKMLIDPVSGSVTLSNESGRDMEMNYYELLSESGSLNEAGWDSVAGKLPGAGSWQANLGVTDPATRLVESNFRNGSAIANGASVSLGTAFNAGDAQDVVARVGTTDGLLNLVSVEYGTVQLLGDFNSNGALDASDIDLLTAAIGTNNPVFDLDNSGIVDAQDHRIWVKDLRFTWFGDANLDGEFNTADLVAVFQIGEYEDGIASNSTWSEGDWSGNGEFDSGDFVVAFQDGGFELGPRVAASVPEPSAWSMIFLGVLTIWQRRRLVRWHRG